jgi:hypothetical protein
LNPSPDGFKRVPAVDRFLLRDGLATERCVFMDEQRLLKTILSNPRHWAGFMRYRSGRKKCAKLACARQPCGEHRLG